MNRRDIPFTDHERRVTQMMHGFGQAVPPWPTLPDEHTRKARAALILEEAIEFANAAGLDVCVKLVDGTGISLSPNRANGMGAAKPHEFWLEKSYHEPSLPAMMDACSDIYVVTTGTFVACGVPITPCLELVDSNNLLKITAGRLDEATGKFIKAPNHPVPNYEHLMASLGYAPKVRDV